jgi:hypothetical protein
MIRFRWEVLMDININEMSIGFDEKARGSLSSSTLVQAHVQRDPFWLGYTGSLPAPDQNQAKNPLHAHGRRASLADLCKM